MNFKFFLVSGTCFGNFMRDDDKINFNIILSKLQLSINNIDNPIIMWRHLTRFSTKTQNAKMWKAKTQNKRRIPNA